MSDLKLHYLHEARSSIGRYLEESGPGSLLTYGMAAALLSIAESLDAINKRDSDDVGRANGVG